MKKILLFLLFLPLLSSCDANLYQAMLSGMESFNRGMMYGNIATMNGGVSALNGGLPTNLQPNVAAEQAAQIINSNMQSQIGNYLETEAKNQEFQQNMIQQFSEDVWKHPERYSSVPVDAGGINVNGGGSFGSSSSGYTPSSTSSTTTGRQCDVCRGSGKCRTCNGKRVYWISTSAGQGPCPNCSDGKCRSCGGTGKRKLSF